MRSGRSGRVEQAAKKVVDDLEDSLRGVALCSAPGVATHRNGGALLTIRFRGTPPHRRRRSGMLETIVVILIILWLLGLVSSYTMGGFIHALLVIAIIVIVIRVLQGRKPLG